MSRVYRARNTLIGQTVVVKVLTEEGSADQEARARFLEEARTLGNITHDNIIRVYDYGEDEQGHPYMVMEFLQGEDLGALIAQGRTGGLTEKLQVMLQVARALEHIHSLTPQIIHRDIKPANIRVTPSGTAKLMDFGIAKRQDLALTRPGMTAGSPYYMAPEQVMGRGVTHLVDIYAFGAVLFELLTGRRLIQGAGLEEVFGSILHGAPDLGPLQQAETPPALADLVARCVAKDPAQRPQSFTAVRQELEKLLTPQPAEVTAIRPQPSPVRRRWWLAPAAILAVVAALVGGYFALRPSGAASEITIAVPPGMVAVAAGAFLAGQDRHAESLPAFYIDRTEVSNASYASFCQAVRRPLPEGFPSDRPTEPVANITFVDAREFARWASKRLPTALEWEKAARGTDGRLFPWGNQPEATRANVKGNPSLETPSLAPVDAFPEGASPCGARNMAGNVWEFVDQFQTPSPAALEAFKTLLSPPPSATEAWYQIRGGSYLEPLLENVLWDFASVPARYRNVNIGFRCVKEAK